MTCSCGNDSIFCQGMLDAKPPGRKCYCTDVLLYRVYFCTAARQYRTAETLPLTRTEPSMHAMIL